eukprot:gene9375-21569_t
MILATAAAQGQVTCDSAGSSSVAIALHLPAIPPQTDLLQLEIYSAATAPRPFAIQTAVPTSVGMVVEDLLPDVEYFFKFRTHPSTAPSIVQGWRNSTDGNAVGCKTTPAKPNTPHTLRRRSSTNSGDTAILQLGWDWGGSKCTGMIPITYVRLREETTHPSASFKQLQKLASNTILTKVMVPADCKQERGSANLEGLAPGSSYIVAVGDSDPVRFRTSGGKTQFTDMYRVSEYTYEIDFLENHNSASRQGQTAFLTSTNDNLFFQLSKSPVTLYCVEHELVEDESGYAPYVSCN